MASSTYYRSRRNGLYYDGPAAQNVVADPTTIKLAAPLVASGIVMLILGTVVAGIGLGMDPVVGAFGSTSDPGVAWQWLGVILQVIGGAVLAVGAYRAAVGIDTAHRLARWSAIKDRVVDID